MYKKKIRSIFAKILVLSLLLSYPSSLNAGVYSEENIDQSLRATSYANGDTPPGQLFNAPVASEFSMRGEPGRNVLVTTTEGSIQLEVPDRGIRAFVSAGRTFDLGESAVPKASSAGEVKAMDSDYQGEPLDPTKAQLKDAHDIAKIDYEELPGFTLNKYIEFNVDMLPENLHLADKDSPERKLAEGILNAIVSRMFQYYGKKDKRYVKKIFLDLVTRSGDKNKLQTAKEIFHNLDIVKKHGLDELLGTAPDKTPISDKIIITYKNDTAELAYPVLMLETESIAEDKIMVYPWHAVIDLSVRILSINREISPTQQTQIYNSIDSLLTYLKGEQVKPELLNNLLSNKIEDIKKAAVALALPHVEKVDLDKIDQLIYIMLEVAKYA
ncbi:MAG: hypothetical protein ABH843_06880 [Candidatus Omnitrophota bacterium]